MILRVPKVGLMDCRPVYEKKQVKTKHGTVIPVSELRGFTFRYQAEGGEPEAIQPTLYPDKQSAQQAARQYLWVKVADQNLISSDEFNKIHWEN